MAKYRVNKKGVAKARQMIDAHQYDLHTSWTEGQPSTDDENGFIERHGLDDYLAWHVAIDNEASDDTKDQANFPYGDFRRVFRSGLIAAKTRAAQNDHAEIEKAADRLLQHLDEVASIKSS
jgi:hypothetical protein